MIVESEDGNIYASTEFGDVYIFNKDKELLKKPTKGKEVSEEEYHAIVEAKMKEMGVEGEGGSG